jgi:LPS sulfotransferase NodH
MTLLSQLGAHLSKAQLAGFLGLMSLVLREPETPPVAFVLGCARSGTSILGELLDAHPQVNYLFEANKIWERAGTAANGSHRLTAGQATARVCREIRREFCRQRRTGAALVVEKCPRSAVRIPFLRAVFPRAKLIHIIRDGRDTACSLVPGMASGRWLHVRPPDWQDIQDQYEGVVRCAVAWQSIVELAMKDQQGSEYLDVRYERLIADPLGKAHALLDFLHLPPAPAVCQFAQRIQDRTAGSYQARFQSRWSRNDHECRVGRWQENLSKEHQDTIHELIGPTLTRLGYEVPMACNRSPSLV